jgi:hypothetical protein
MSKTLTQRLSLALLALLSAGSIIAIAPQAAVSEQRNDIAHPRTPSRFSFYNRHRRSYRVASALHFAHSKLHDILLLTPLSDHAQQDDQFYQEVRAMYDSPPRIEPTMELYAPYAARATWRLFRTIDGIHLLHEMTEDVLADPDIAWEDKDAELNAIYELYQERYSDVALSPAPLDVTMRRAAVMMKPYFSLVRNYYPKNNNFFYAAHWWHPAVYESLMTGGNGEGQDVMMNAMEDRFRDDVIPNPPQRMLLSREGSPRYSRLSPETANVFDNLHMLHGITYDIFAYDGWTIEQKRAELYRVLDAMAYQPGDAALVRKFTTPRPDISPLDYDDWVTSNEGAMATMMLEMLDEMMVVHGAGDRGGGHDSGGHDGMNHPGGHREQDEMNHDEMNHDEMNHDGMNPMHGGDHGNHGEMDHGGHDVMKHNGIDHGEANRGEMTPEDMKRDDRGNQDAPIDRLRAQLRLKLTPGIQEGEIAGSFADAVREIMPDMMMPGMDQPGSVSPVMVQAMIDGWVEKYGSLPDIAPMPMDREPTIEDVRAIVSGSSEPSGGADVSDRSGVR